jgi:hypothetical protein
MGAAVFRESGMSVKPSGFTWTCDWCESTAFSKSDKEPPEDWRKPRHELRKIEASHVCSPDCEENLYRADDIVHNLGNDLERLVRYHWGKPRTTPPDLDSVSVQVEHTENGKPTVLMTPVDV